MADPARFGTDLRLLANLEEQIDRSRGEDLKSSLRAGSGQIDLEPISGVANLHQALLLRFLTPRGREPLPFFDKRSESLRVAILMSIDPIESGYSY